MLLLTGLLVAFALDSPGLAQLTPAPPPPVAPQRAAPVGGAPPPLPQPPSEPYGTPLLGVQPRLIVPDPTAPYPLPPQPSQTHLPAFLPSPTLTAGGLAFDLHPSVTFAEEYSDNFFITSSNKTDNFRSTISPGLLVGINGPRTRGTLLTNLGVAQDSIDSFGDLHFFPSLSVAVKHAFDPRLSVSLVDTFAHSDEPALANQFGLQQQRQTFTSNTLGLSVDWLVDLLAAQAYYQLFTFSGTTDTVASIFGADVGIPLGTRMALKVGYELSFGSTTGGDTNNDSTGNLMWASVARQIGPSAVAGLSTSYQLQSFDSTRIWNGSVFGAYQLTGRLSISGSAGYSILTSDSTGNFSTFSTNTSASYTFAKAVLALAFLQDFNQTFFQGQSFGIVLTRSYTGSFSYAVTPFIDVGARVSYNQNEFTGIGNSSGNPNSDAFSGGASVSWRVLRWLTMGLDYTYTRYNSGATSGSAATVNQAAIRASASF